MTKKPVLIPLDDTGPTPSEAPPVPDILDAAPEGQAMQMAARLSARKPSHITKLFWAALLSLITAVVSITAYDFLMGLIARNTLLGYGVTALTALVLFALLCIAVGELAALARLRRIDKLQHQARSALEAESLDQARAVTTALHSLYRDRDDLTWHLTRLKDREEDQFDATALLGLAEQELLAPLDQRSRQEIEAAARQVATVTALVPLALADVFAALTSNLRMIRRIAEIYGGRGGLWGNWRLLRSVMTHLVATGAVAVGDDLLEPLIGGGLLGKLSRRFGEGLVNGALTARVGVAALEVCRPIPFTRQKRPSARSIVKTALTGLFGKTGA